MKLIRLLKALHANVEVMFVGNDITKKIDCISLLSRRGVSTQEKSSKFEVLFVAASNRVYADQVSFDNSNLSNVNVDDVSHMPIVDRFCRCKQETAKIPQMLNRG